MPVPLRLAANHTITLADATAPGVANAAKHAEQGLLRIAPAQVAASKIAVGRGITAARVVVIGRTFRLQIDLHAHTGVHPVVAATGATQRPAIGTVRLVMVLNLRARP